MPICSKTHKHGAYILPEYRWTNTSQQNKQVQYIETLSAKVIQAMCHYHLVDLREAQQPPPSKYGCSRFRRVQRPIPNILGLKKAFQEYM
jgi:hypothetical protein